jgi:cytochrome c553
MPPAPLKKSLSLIVLAPLASVLVAQWVARPAAAGPVEAKVARGRHLVESMACSDCHTPMKFDARAGMPVPDRDRFLSGHPGGAPVPAALPDGTAMAVGQTGTSFRMPFGMVYAANLTPDPTGIEGWSEEMFVNALRTGRHMGGTGRPIYPPMPWTSFRNLSDDDLKAIYAFLRTIPPVRNEVPEVQMPPPVEMSFIRLNDGISTTNPAPSARPARRPGA